MAVSGLIYESFSSYLLISIDEKYIIETDEINFVPAPPTSFRHLVIYKQKSQHYAKLITVDVICHSTER